MPRLVKRIAVATAALLVLAGAALGVLVARFEPETYRAEIVGALSALSGRAVAIGGPIALDLFPRPRVTVDDLSIANPAWAANPHLLRVARVEAVVAPRSLLAGVPTVRSLLVQAPVVALEIGPGGQPSWDLGGERRGGPAALPAFVTGIAVEGATVRHVDHRTGARHEVGIDRLRAHGDGPDEPLSFAFDARVAGRAVAVTGTVRSLATLFAARPVDIGIAARADGVAATVSGRVADALAVTGVDLAIGLSAPSLAALAPALTLPIGGPLRATARLLDDGPGWRIDGIELLAGDSVVSGGGRWLPGAPRPRLALSLASARIALAAPAAEPARPARAGGAAGRVVPDWPIPVDWLGIADADVALDVAELSVGPVGASGFAARGRLEAGRLRATATAAVEGGRVSTSLELAPATAGAALALRLAGDGVELGPIVNALGGESLASGGSATFEVDLRGAGRSTRAVAGTLDGHARGSIGPARIRTRLLDLAGGDLVTRIAGSLVPAGTGAAETPLECVAFDLPFAGGIMRSERALGARTEQVAMLAGGSVDLATEAIDLAVAPRPRTGIGIGAGLIVRSVRLEGTIAAPRLGADAGGALIAGASVGAAVVTGGLSVLLQGAYERLSGEVDPCALVAGRAPGEAAGEAIEGIGGALKGLFGN